MDTNPNKNAKIIGLNPCKISLWVFLTNCVYCLYLREYTYAVLFLVLTTTSFFFRWVAKEDPLYKVFKYADLVAVQIVVWYSIYTYMTRTTRQSVPLIFMFYMILFYYVGKWIGQFCGDCDKSTGLHYHALLHLCASAGHNFILMDLR